MTELYFILGCCLAMAIFVAWKQTRPETEDAQPGHSNKRCNRCRHDLDGM